jgi:hypothetical protein
MKVRITPTGVTILSDQETRIQVEVTDVEIKLHNGREIQLSLCENLPNTRVKVVGNTLHADWHDDGIPATSHPPEG